MDQFIIRACKTTADFEKAKQLTLDYMDWLGMDLCFQNIDKELETFDQMYGDPWGCFLLAEFNGKLAGGVGLRQLENGTCEMKRLFLYEDYKAKGMGKSLCAAIITKAKEMRYKKMRLDTVARLKAANGLYEKFGFYDIKPYNYNPDSTVRYMEKIL